MKQYESYSNNLRTKNQKTNYITIHIARKLDTLYENNVKNYFIQENALSLLIRMKRRLGRKKRRLGRKKRRQGRK